MHLKSYRILSHKVCILDTLDITVLTSKKLTILQENWFHEQNDEFQHLVGNSHLYVYSGLYVYSFRENFPPVRLFPPVLLFRT